MNDLMKRIQRIFAFKSPLPCHSFKKNATKSEDVGAVINVLEVTLRLLR
jgi:hypothetical protein